jgi:predicted phage tail protein
MVNLKVGGLLLVAGGVLFLLSDTIFGDSEAASYSMFFGMITFPLGVFLTLVGLIQVLIAKFKGRSE